MKVKIFIDNEESELILNKDELRKFQIFITKLGGRSVGKPEIPVEKPKSDLSQFKTVGFVSGNKLKIDIKRNRELILKHIEMLNHEVEICIINGGVVSNMLRKICKDKNISYRLFCSKNNLPINVDKNCTVLEDSVFIDHFLNVPEFFIVLGDCHLLEHLKSKNKNFLKLEN